MSTEDDHYYRTGQHYEPDVCEDEAETTEPEWEGRAEPAQDDDPFSAPIYSVADVEQYRELLDRAHRGTSFVSEKRAEGRLQEYVSHMTALYTRLAPLAMTPEARAALLEGMAQHKEGYIKHMVAWAHAHSRCISTMIAGPSKFPVRRAEKASASADKRAEEWLAFSAKSEERLRKALMKLRPAEVVRDEKQAHILYRIRAGLPVYSVVGFVERLAQNGDVEAVAFALRHLRERKAFTSRHSIWRQQEIAEAIRAKREAEATKAEADGNLEISFDGGVIVDNVAEDRVQILFDGKPAEPVRTAMKAEGWRYAPSTSAWQRKRTANALASAKRLMGVA